MVGVMEDSMRLPAQWRFCRPKAELVGVAGLDGEIVHLIIEEEARPLHYHFRAIHAVQRGGDGDRIAGRIDNGKMRRLGAFYRRHIAWLDLLTGGFCRRNIGIARGDIGAVGQRVQIDRDEIHIAQMVGAVGIGALQFGHQVNMRGGIMPQRGDVISFRALQKLRQRHPAGTGRRHGTISCPR